MFRWGRVWMVAALALGACSAPAPRSRDRPTPARPDKAKLFGDPGLVPTREGERARRELARAGEIEKAIAILPEVRQARVDVELDPADRIARILVVVEARRSDAELDIALRRIVSSVAGPGSADTTEFVVHTRPEPRPDEPPSWALLATVLALGMSLGISYERARRIVARRRRSRLRRRPSSG